MLFYRILSAHGFAFVVLRDANKTFFSTPRQD